MKPSKLIVAFTTKLIPGVPVPEFTPPANYKDPAKIEEWKEKELNKYVERAKDQPYTGTFERVVIADPANKRMGSWSSPENDPVCIEVRNWILSEYPDAWEHSTHARHGVPDAVFIGFHPRLFLKILGLECSLPQNQPQKDGKPDPKKLNVLPLSMWYGNSDHRDLLEAVCPKEFDTNLDYILKLRGIDRGDWTGPGCSADLLEKELQIATEIAAQLGMMAETYSE